MWHGILSNRLGIEIVGWFVQKRKMVDKDYEGSILLSKSKAPTKTLSFLFLNHKSGFLQCVCNLTLDLIPLQSLHPTRAVQEASFLPLFSEHPT